MASCLVIGANGFLGSHLVDELVSRGHEVTAFDRFSSQQAAYSALGVRQIAGDFMNQSDVTEAVAGAQFVFHFVSTTTPVTAENDPTLDVRTNIASSIELFQHCVDAGVQKLFFASTGGAIYGDQPRTSFSETVSPLPVSPYAIGKLAIEGYLRYFGKKYGLDSISFRISNPYGPRQRANKKQGVIPIFLSRMARGLPLTVYGDGSMVRDYLYVRDAVRMIGDTVGGDSNESVYNIGSGTGTSVSELLDVARRVTGIEPDIEVKPVPSTFLDRVVLDTSRFTSEFGYDEFVSLERGIADTWGHVTGESR
ncbi:UDP-glucose 4-epimerase [Agreia sp. Leaf244]|uniref:NAD-dependent epimerase/dehydratase family protein n=1 Tax=Agreia sp. Leaf244 TaxID=1736305 RepID=UPI0006FA0E74|nr:NAD-dependent epimerase/dehydratase family protein [Agreia sp. Leaf244]KQO11119.1 UDP-glucose 4-epimerase [Agreia sp. Leaf244]